MIKSMNMNELDGYDERGTSMKRTARLAAGFATDNDAERCQRYGEARLVLTHHPREKRAPTLGICARVDQVVQLHATLRCNVPSDAIGEQGVESVHGPLKVTARDKQRHCLTGTGAECRAL